MSPAPPPAPPRNNPSILPRRHGPGILFPSGLFYLGSLAGGPATSRFLSSGFVGILGKLNKIEDDLNGSLFYCFLAVSSDGTMDTHNIVVVFFFIGPRIYLRWRVQNCGRGGVRDREWAVFRVGHFLFEMCYQHISLSRIEWKSMDIFGVCRFERPGTQFELALYWREGGTGGDSSPVEWISSRSCCCFSGTDNISGCWVAGAATNGFTIRVGPASTLDCLAPCLRAAVNDCAGPSPAAAVSSGEGRLMCDFAVCSVVGVDDLEIFHQTILKQMKYLSLLAKSHNIPGFGKDPSPCPVWGGGGGTRGRGRGEDPVRICCAIPLLQM
ncbi:uncharacterized protein H6S33_012667 [Morchella sextelata]|uniref:uncharacterized protein n=1 Tax=Morchella sextelata TaxID=1174677 RepID=UPI001D037F95|nr:uncharacterized protein H6S33_012667 [Morchella sextelata]KAH0610121.1 hypothetical protein H6S33_012667 [Morchella sextelata]